MVIEPIENRADPLDRIAVFTHRLVNLRQLEPDLSDLRVLVFQRVAQDRQRLFIALCGGEAVSGLQDTAKRPVPSGDVEMMLTQSAVVSASDRLASSSASLCSPWTRRRNASDSTAAA
jgi:hypothetical protein